MVFWAACGQPVFNGSHVQPGSAERQAVAGGLIAHEVLSSTRSNCMASSFTPKRKILALVLRIEKLIDITSWSRLATGSSPRGTLLTNVDRPALPCIILHCWCIPLCWVFLSNANVVLLAMNPGIRAMKPGIAMLAVMTSATIFLCLASCGTAEVSDSDVLLGVEPASSQGQRYLLSLAYKTMHHNSTTTLTTAASAQNIRVVTIGVTYSKW